MAKQVKPPSQYWFIGAEWIEFPQQQLIATANQRPPQPVMMRKNLIIQEHPALHYGRMVMQNPTYFVTMAVLCSPDVVARLETAGVLGNADGEPTVGQETAPQAAPEPSPAPAPESYVLHRPEGYFVRETDTGQWRMGNLGEATRFNTPEEAQREADTTYRDWETVPTSKAE